MESCFLDTSALVKRYHVESGTAVVDQLFGQANALLISRLGMVEAISALATKVRTGALTTDDYLLATKRFLGDVKVRRIAVVRILVGHFREAERLIGRHATSRRLRTLDAIQLAVAKELHAHGRAACFASADASLLAVAGAEGLTVFNPAATS